MFKQLIKLQRDGVPSPQGLGSKPLVLAVVLGVAVHWVFATFIHSFIHSFMRIFLYSSARWFDWCTH
jgi:hypothetical protein